MDTADLTGLLRLALQNEAILDRALFGGKLAAMWHRIKFLLGATASGARAQNIHAHYDIGSDFYRLWLDETWTYSSALFGDDQARASMPLHGPSRPSTSASLDVLSPAPGARLLEIGCGWEASPSARWIGACLDGRDHFPGPALTWPRGGWRAWRSGRLAPDRLP